MAVKAMSSILETATNLPDFMAEESQSKVAPQISTQPIVKFIKSRPLLVVEVEDQMLLQQAGGMTDQQMMNLN